MPNRIVRDGLLESEAVLSCTVEARWLYVAMLLTADDLGICEATEFKLARRADVKRDHVPALLTQLQDRDLVRLYSTEATGMRTFAFIPRFGQRFRLLTIKHPLPPAALLDEDAISKLGAVTSDRIKAALPTEINDLLAKMSDTCPQMPAHVRQLRTQTQTQTKTQTQTQTLNTKDIATSSLVAEAAPQRRETDLIGDEGHGETLTRESVPPCPTQEIVDAFHKALPMLPAIALLNAQRKQAIAARWRDVVTTDKLDRAGGLLFFQRYFEHAAASPFLTGRAATRAGERPWKAGFDWLMRPANFAKVIEGNYHHHQEIKA